MKIKAKTHLSPAYCTRYVELEVRGGKVSHTGEVKPSSLRNANLITLYGKLQSGLTEVVQDFSICSRVPPERAVQSAESLGNVLMNKSENIRALNVCLSY